ncbi:MAG: hypothetical protein MUP70_04930 [Candidatus Aminicenantes bacterium]|nr:hypothetical protein [Candidatus Aminicenantes bacterium]
MTEKDILKWLLDGDVSIQYQIHRDLLNEERPDLQKRIAKEGWGAAFLSRRRENGHWGMGFYQPKWTSTHYTLLDLRNLNISPNVLEIQETISLILRNHKDEDGGINPAKTVSKSDVCINGMVLNYACYFRSDESDLRSIVDCLIGQQMTDGGFNCRSNRPGAVHSSLHTTLSVAEGLWEYRKNGYTYRLEEVKRMEEETREFMLQHRLFRSDRTGAIIRPGFLRLPYPPRWFYDILRALDYFLSAGVSYDPRMQDAMDVLIKKRRPDNRWPLQAAHPGKVHFQMEKAGEPSRWNTLRALRVIKHFNRS